MGEREKKAIEQVMTHAENLRIPLRNLVKKDRHGHRQQSGRFRLLSLCAHHDAQASGVDAHG